MITKADIIKALKKQVAVDMELAMRDALGPFEKERLLEMQAFLEDPKAAKAARDTKIVEALRTYLASYEKALMAAGERSRTEDILSTIPKPECLAKFQVEPVMSIAKSPTGPQYLAILFIADGA